MSVPVAEIVRRYRAGESGPTIARDVHVHVSTIYYYLRKAGITCRPAGPQTAISSSEMRRTVVLYRAYGAARAGEILGLHPWTVRWRVRQAGYPLNNEVGQC